MKILHLVEYAGLRLLMILTSRLSPNTASWLGARLGDLVFYVVRSRKKLVMEQLVRAFNASGNTRNLRKMARSVYRQLGRTATEHARLLAKETKDVRDRLTISGENHIEQARRKGRGVILITGHFGYWELLGATVASLGHPITVVAKDLHNPAVNRLILAARERLGMGVTNMNTAATPILRALRRNECVGLLADQDAGPDGVFIDFLGSPASTYQGPAVFALRTGAAIIPCFIIRCGAEQHRVCFEAPINVVASGDDSADIEIITQTYTNVLADYILDYPDHWFWVHRRWKSRSPIISNHVF